DRDLLVTCVSQDELQDERGSTGPFHGDIHQDGSPVCASRMRLQRRMSDARRRIGSRWATSDRYHPGQERAHDRHYAVGLRLLHHPPVPARLLVHPSRAASRPPTHLPVRRTRPKPPPVQTHPTDPKAVPSYSPRRRERRSPNPTPSSAPRITGPSEAGS